MDKPDNSWVRKNNDVKNPNWKKHTFLGIFAVSFVYIANLFAVGALVNLVAFLFGLGVGDFVFKKLEKWVQSVKARNLFTVIIACTVFSIGLFSYVLSQQMKTIPERFEKSFEETTKTYKKYLEKLKLEVKELEQKKNTVANRNNEFREGNNELTRESEEYRERIYRLIQSNEQFRRGIETATRENNELRERIRTAEESSYNIINKAIRGVESLQEATETEIDIAITILDREFYKIEREIEELQREFKSITEGK